MKQAFIGDSTWFWYEDDADFWIGRGIISGFEDDDVVVITTDCWIDLEPDETGPYAIEYKTTRDKLCDTRDDALNAAAAKYRERIEQAFEDWEAQNRAAKKEAQKLHPAPKVPFKYKEGDEVYVVIPFASGMIVELHHGKVVSTPQSDNPRWFPFDDGGMTTMAPTSFVASSADEAIALYTEAKKQAIIKDFDRRNNAARCN